MGQLKYKLRYKETKTAKFFMEQNFKQIFDGYTRKLLIGKDVLFRLSYWQHIRKPTKPLASSFINTLESRGRSLDVSKKKLYGLEAGVSLLSELRMHAKTPLIRTESLPSWPKQVLR